MADRADTVVATIKQPGRGAFLEELFGWAAIPDPFPTAQAHADALLTSPSQHLTFQTVQVSYPVKRHPWDNIVLEQVMFGAEANLPFKLDAESETPASARIKLATNDTMGGGADAVARGDRRVSYFMFDATVIEVTFKPGMTGIARVLAARLGG